MTAHLGDEALTSVLDGDAAGDAVAHARSCGRCAARLEQLAGAARAVGAAPPPPSPPRREAMLAAALDTVSPAQRAGTGAGAPPSAGRRPALLRPWLAAAAAVAAVAVAVPVVRSQLGADGDRTLAAPQHQAGAPEGAGAGDPSPTGPTLGEIDLDALRADPPTFDELAAGLSSDQEDAASAPEPSRSLAARPSEGTPAADAAAPSGGSPCEASVRRRRPELGSLAYAATATAEGAPVEVLAFDAAGRGEGGSAGQLFVVTVGECSELAAVPLRR